MKKLWLFLLLALVLVFPACAETQDDAILTCLKNAYPQAEFHQITQWGDTAAAAFENGNTKVLCIMERRNGQWQMVVNSGSILLQEEALPSLLLDTDEVLFWSYSIWPHTNFHAYRAKDGEWRFADEIITEDSGTGSVLETMLGWQNTTGGVFTYTAAYYDDNDNRISEPLAKTIPAMWMADRIALQSFDIARFPKLEVEEYDGQWPDQAFMREAAGYLMPDYTYVGGSLAGGNLQFLMDKPDGTRIFAGCVYDLGPQLTESSPLPADTTYGFENFTNSLCVNGAIVTLQHFPNHPWWGIRYLMGNGEELQFGMNCVLSSAEYTTLYFGYHPWNNIASINWACLPKSLEEAVDVLNADEWALVDNPNPADRLHLREKPDKNSKSLGKYYSGTPVHILDARREWTEVEIFGQIGWMMTKYLDDRQPYRINLTVFPQLTVKKQTVSLCGAMYASTEIRKLSSTYGMYVIGIIGDTWYHVWFPLTNEAGFVQQSELQ